MNHVARRVTRLTAVVVIGLIMVPSAYGQFPTYRVVVIEPLPGDEETEAYDLNNVGDVVGHSYRWVTQGNTEKKVGTGFFYVDGTMTDIGMYLDAPTIATGTNDLRQVVGYGYGDFYQPFLWENGTKHALQPMLGVTPGPITDINNHSWITGAATVDGYGGRAFVWHDDTYTIIGTEAPGYYTLGQVVNDIDHVMVSIDWLGNDFGTYLWTNSLDSIVYQPFQHGGRGMNNHDEITGYFPCGDGCTSFLWRDGDVVDTGPGDG